jgi:transposase InsO family protein
MLRRVRGKSVADRGQAADRERWARLRFAIIGPLLAAPPAKGELQAALRELSARSWQHPVSGERVRFGMSTLERWFYAARGAGDDPVTVLRTRVRADAGRSRRVSATLMAALEAQYRQHPGWSVRLHYDNLRAALGAAELPSYATVRRYFAVHGLRRLRRRVETVKHFAPREVRSFEVEHTNALWHLDFHECSRNVATAQGRWIKPVALSVLDDRSRLVCHIQWYLDQTTRSLVHGFSQALMRRALPRALMTDNGAAMISDEFKNGLHRLGIVHETTLPYSPWANGKQENLWATLEGRLMAMLEGVSQLTLELLNRATHAWIEQEYHRAHHPELGCSPLERYRAGPDVGRSCPTTEVVSRAFRIEVTRSQRRSDSTAALHGRRFEVPSQFAHLRELRLRYARWDLSAVDLIDPRSGAVLCALYPLDKSANAAGARRVLAKAGEAMALRPAAGDMAPLLKKLLAEFAATGLPPPYLPDEDP